VESIEDVTIKIIAFEAKDQKLDKRNEDFKSSATKTGNMGRQTREVNFLENQCENCKLKKHKKDGCC